ncbi:uncharacterized protein LAESUDRAFT_731287 [Laetiporus sulphureus 93-53]|uniref:Uncharacterized protein n=1 Tax=Laetiporus sulphureus 93-53 TaxID=1314785 RepID=A0A165BPJ0_9APHY|nr:uncharacterized protein LAESUDRAFT_731287 [Laetiporus sulphureus 93-53]KZT01422.1 hypothetical protein LAESUDRAFT_731287 [Laetiporus sulphureus 93-53]
MARNVDAERNNEKLFPIFRKNLSDGVFTTFKATSDKLASWLSRDRAYYARALPIIVELLETAHVQVRRAGGTPGNQSLWAEPYAKLIHTVYPFLPLFTNPLLKARVENLIRELDSISGVSDHPLQRSQGLPILPAASIAMQNDAHAGGSLQAAFPIKTEPSETYGAPVSAGSTSYLFPISQAPIKQETAEDAAPQLPLPLQTAAEPNSTQVEPKSKKSFIDVDEFIQADLEWYQVGKQQTASKESDGAATAVTSPAAHDHHEKVPAADASAAIGSVEKNPNEPTSSISTAASPIADAKAEVTVEDQSSPSNATQAGSSAAVDDAATKFTSSVTSPTLPRLKNPLNSIASQKLDKKKKKKGPPGLRYLPVPPDEKMVASMSGEGVTSVLVEGTEEQQTPDAMQKDEIRMASPDASRDVKEHAESDKASDDVTRPLVVAESNPAEGAPSVQERDESVHATRHHESLAETPAGAALPPHPSPSREEFRPQQATEGPVEGDVDMVDEQQDRQKDIAEASEQSMEVDEMLRQGPTASNEADDREMQPEPTAESETVEAITQFATPAVEPPVEAGGGLAEPLQQPAEAAQDVLPDDAAGEVPLHEGGFEHNPAEESSTAPEPQPLAQIEHEAADLPSPSTVSVPRKRLRSLSITDSSSRQKLRTSSPSRKSPGEETAERMTQASDAGSPSGDDARKSPLALEARLDEQVEPLSHVDIETSHSTEGTDEGMEEGEVDSTLQNSEVDTSLRAHDNVAAPSLAQDAVRDRMTIDESQLLERIVSPPTQAAPAGKSPRAASIVPGKTSVRCDPVIPGDDDDVIEEGEISSQLLDEELEHTDAGEKGEIMQNGPSRRPAYVRRLPLDSDTLAEPAVIIWSSQGSAKIETVVEFDLNPDHAALISQWVGRYDTRDDMTRSKCMSISSFALSDCTERVRENSDMSLEEVTNDLPTMWPRDGKLWAMLKNGQVDHGFTLSPPFIRQDESIVDISKIVTAGKNQLRIFQLNDYSSYVFTIRLHTPTAAQLEELQQRRYHKDNWNNFLQSLGTFKSPKLDLPGEVSVTSA